MNKKRNVLFILIFLILFNIFNLPSGATNLDSLDINVELLDNGNANIIMNWNYYDDQGTEHYIPINTNGIDIINFEVERNGLAYNDIGEWDLDASFEEKASKYGIVDHGDQVELCWGISEYGNNNYTVKYTVVDMIKNLDDAQVLYYQFLNSDLSEAPEKFTISIGGPEDYDENILMWAFGFDGEINLVDSKIKAYSHSPLYSNNYATILLKFPPAYFDNNLNSSMDLNFEELKALAFEGSEYVDYDDPENQEILEEENSSSSTPFFLIPFIGILSLFSVFLVKIFKLHDESIPINKKDYKGEYYRDIPYPLEEGLEDLYYILDKINLSSYEDYITFYFLKWIKDGALEETDYEDGFLFKKNKKGLKISHQPEFNSKSEEMFFKFLIEAAGSDKMLEDNEFNKWMQKNTDRFFKFIQSLEDNSEAVLLDKEFLILEDRKSMFITNKAKVLSDKGLVLTENLIKFYNYLYDFSLLNERQAVNVHIWDKLMLYAAIFGITERVQKEFEKLYPKYFERSDINYNINTLYLTNMYTRSIVNSYQSHTSASSFSASSGFGGGTSIGGGGGSFGGGSGGGTR